MEGFFKPAEIRSTRPGGDLAPKCGACGLYKGCRHPKMVPWGSGSLGALVVGEAPGEQEDAEGQPFVGASGEFLREAVGRAGFNFDDLRITNAIICHPPDNKMPQKGREVGYCRPNLVKTIEEFRPRVLITLGKSALESVLQPYWKDDLLTLDRWVGWKIPAEKHWICPTWHPSYILRERNPAVRGLMERMFVQHVEAALSIDSDPPEIPDFKDKVEQVFDERAIWDALKWFDTQGGLIAFDYETNSLKPEYPKSRIYSAAVSNGRRTVAYPWTPRAKAATSILLRSSRTRKVASNMKFEQRWTIKHLGHPITNLDLDTVVAAHVLDNRPKIASLKFQAFVLMGVPSYNDHVHPFLESADGSHYNRIHEVEITELLHYNGIDAFLEMHLGRRQRIILAEETRP